MLPLREWLELGQAMLDLQFVFAKKYFKKHSVEEIEIGTGGRIKADGKTYRAGIYRLEVKV